MAEGCDFHCNNKDCNNFGKVIILHGIWPTKNIDEAIDESEDPERKEALVHRKEEGRTTALFVFPQDNKKNPVGYRMQFYCPSCLRIEDFDCSPDREQAYKLYKFPPICEACNGSRISLNTAIMDGIYCPLCLTRLHCFHWFTKT